MGFRGSRQVAVVISVAGLAGTFQAATADAHRHRQPTFVASADCSGHVRRPSMIVIACGNSNFYVNHLHYSRYGHRTASATGLLRYSPCFPDCPQPEFKSYRGSIILSNIGFCQGRRYYQRISWRFQNKHPFPNGHASIRPSACSRL